MSRIFLEKELCTTRNVLGVYPGRPKWTRNGWKKIKKFHVLKKNGFTGQSWSAPTVSVVSSVADPDPRHFGKPGLDPHQSEKSDPDELWRLKMEPWRALGDNKQRRGGSQNGVVESLYASGRRFASSWWGVGYGSGPASKRKVGSGSQSQWKVGSGSPSKWKFGSTALVVRAVLRIRDVYPGSRGILIFTHPGSRISDPGSKSATLSKRKPVPGKNNNALYLVKGKSVTNYRYPGTGTERKFLIYFKENPTSDVCSLYQGCGSVFIWYGSGSSILGWIPIQIRIQSGSRV